MKYGESLRQRSIAAWSHHNIDYDDIKHFIKDQTTPGKGKSIAIPGTGDDKLLEFETALLNILAAQHERIDLFVKSKSWEIRCRLDHAEKQIRQLSDNLVVGADQRPITVTRLERYGRVEHELLKAGEEIRSLARFTAAQRTGFRKLLKKYRKWTGSTHLEDRFRDEVTSHPKSFTHLDLGPLLDDYSDSLQRIRGLYEAGVRRSNGLDGSSVGSPNAQASSTVAARLQAAIDSGSKVDIDTALSTVPFGENGTVASYFVHPECVVELQMLLLSHCTYRLARSRNNSLASPVTSSPETGAYDAEAFAPDFFNLVVDDPARFGQEQSALTIQDREHRPGASPQRARFCATWNNEEEAKLSFRAAGVPPRITSIKRKHIDALFDRGACFNAKGDKELREFRTVIEKDEHMQPIYRLSACRSRLIGLKNGVEDMTLVALDTNICIQPGTAQAEDNGKFIFPFALLTVRHEGLKNRDLLSALDQSHLVERVRGFSIEYHAVWQVCRGRGIVQPAWAPIMDRDIRKLPPPALASRHSRSGSRSGSRTASTPSEQGGTDSATAVETGRDTTTLISFEEAPLRSFRKKRRGAYDRTPLVESSPLQRYWSEYDHPEDDDGGDAYVIYIDPDEKSSVERFIEKLGAFFSIRKPDDASAMLDDDQSSGDEDDDDRYPLAAEENRELIPRSHRRDRAAYGTLPYTTEDGPAIMSVSSPALPPTTTLCYVASLAILIVAYFLAYTGKHKYHYAVDAGILLAVLSSVMFAVVGYAVLWRRSELARQWGGTTNWTAWTLATMVLIVDTIASGGLLAWIWTFGRQ